ncbi:hypothetical protein ABEB36_001543 [Hypothenemus hampei]|uniref:Lysosome-associated membrane glycoprotein 2-like luminal domain-containing protein n=1 Tax=Hypothenemus hampei TaxID=57062 RepID=A0ABD1FF02_HYPHA
MARFGSVYFQFLVVCTSLSSLVDSIELQNKGTPRPRLKPTSLPRAGGQTTTTTKSPKEDSGIAVYRLFYTTATDITCILLKTDAVVEVTFKLNGNDEQADTFIPKDAAVLGTCGEEEIVKMNLVWLGYSLTLSFAKTPGGEHWYLSNVELTVNVDMPKFHGIQRYNSRNKNLRLYNDSMVMPTPVGRSYYCDDEVDIALRTHASDHPPQGVSGVLLLRALQIQAFMHRSDNFSTPYHCKAQRSFRSETAPIAVGSTLAIAALAIVVGYGVFRYYKVSSVQYNTME